MYNFDRVVGVDFSGAQDAGKLIWLASGAIQTRKLIIDSVFPATELPASGKGRDICLPALVDYIERASSTIFGLDFPFGVPRPIVSHSTWADFAASFSDDYESPAAFRKRCRDAAGGRELRRETDAAAKTPFAAYNLRLYRQTFHGIGSLLSPLVARGRVLVAPMQTPAERRPCVIEICPASTLKRWNWYKPYKGSGIEYRDSRRAILDRIEATSEIAIAEQSVRDCVLDNRGGDALDSVIAAWAAFRAIPNLDQPVSDVARMEGFVYV